MPKALHPKAAAFVRQNLFAGLDSFAELENRIAALPDNQSRGDAFEVFAEAYLATQRRHEAAHVWPLNAVPSTVLQQLNLGSKDYGIDGVFQTQLGQLNAYQVKFRTDRAALTWRELSTFMGLADSPQMSSRVLITNCDDLPSVINDRHGFFCIRGTDLDRLEAEDFQAVNAWVADSVFTARKKSPRQHQQEALSALLPALEQHDRVSVIMACGTGKTLVALWVVEQMQADRVLVLVPSLALLRQLLHEPITTTIITSAIAGALGNLSSDAVKAGYRKLQELVLRKCGAAGQAALENWEKKPDSAAWQGALHEELQTANADKDAEIIKATEELLALTGKTSAADGGINQPVSGSNNTVIAVSGSQNVSITA